MGRPGRDRRPLTAAGGGQRLRHQRIRRRFFEKMEADAAGAESKGTIRDPAKNVRVPLPMIDRALTLKNHSIEQILSRLRLKLMYTSYRLWNEGAKQWRG